MGFDIHCIPNIESLPREHFCPVCQLLVNPNEAVQSACGHLFCRPCLAYVASTTTVCPYDNYFVTATDAKPLVESNKVLADTIGNTVVYCLYQTSGCTWMGSLSDSSSHCSGCAFRNSFVVCSWSGIVVANCQWQDHVRACVEMRQVQMNAYIQASVAMATSQASAQGHGVAAATLTQEQWYQQPYQRYYQNYVGNYMHQQPLHLPNFAPQHQVIYVPPIVHTVAQTHSQMQPQPQLQSPSLALHQPHDVFPSPYLGAASLPQAYLSVPPYLQHPSQTFPPAIQSLRDLEAQAHFQTTPLSQTHYLQDTQVPQHQQLHGQIRSQLEIQNLMQPQANTVQTGLAQNTIGQCQSNQPHAYWTGQKIHPQPNQINQLGASPNNMSVYHQDGNQPPQVQNHFPEHVSHVPPPQSLPTVQIPQPSLPSQLTRAQYTKQLVLKYGGAPVPESSDMHSSQQPLSKPSLPQQHTAASTTDVFNNQMHQGDPIYNPHIALKSHLSPIGPVKGLQKHPHTLQQHQPITPIPGLQPQMSHHFATASQVGLGHAAPSFPPVNEADMQRIQNQVPGGSWGQDKVSLNHIVGKQGDEKIVDGLEARLTSESTNIVYGVNRAVEVAAVKIDHKLKGKLTDGCAESVHRPSIVVEGNERGSLGKQVMEEDVGNCWENLGKSLLVEKKDIKDDPSMNGTPLLNPDLLGQDVLRRLDIIRQHQLMNAHLLSENVERSRACSSGSLDIGFHQRSSVMPYEKHEPGLEVRPALRFPQPSIDLGERLFGLGPRSPISQYLAMPSHGYGHLDHELGDGRAETTDTEGRCRLGLLRSAFKGLGNVQMGENVRDADMIGPVDSNGVRLGNAGKWSRYNLQGFSGDGGSSSRGLGTFFPNSGIRETKPTENSDFHSQRKEHQQNSMDKISMFKQRLKQNVKKPKITPAVSSPFSNRDKNEERRFKG